jgi:putative flippase GtrA
VNQDFKPLARRLARFGVVGVTCTVLHAGVATAALAWLGVGPVAANGIGFLFACGASLFAQTVYTFGHSLSVAASTRFLVVACAAALFSSLAVVAMERWTALPDRILVVLAAVAAAVLSFACHSLWTFRHRAEATVG